MSRAVRWGAGNGQRRGQWSWQLVSRPHHCFAGGAERVPGELRAGDQGRRRREGGGQLYRERAGHRRRRRCSIRRRAGRAIEERVGCRRAFPLATMLLLSRPLIGCSRLKLRGTAGAMLSFPSSGRADSGSIALVDATQLSTRLQKGRAESEGERDDASS